MRVKPSITLPDDLLREIDRLDSNRSAFLERAARRYLVDAAKAARSAKDRAILDTHSARLNAEAEGVLEYQWLPR